MMFRRIFLALGVLLCVVSVASADGPNTSGDAVRSGLETLSIMTQADGKRAHMLRVETMRTPEELERGLMFRNYLPEDRGMLFDFKTEKPVMMWMKNTYITLDMIFISKTGRVTHIEENAEPLSEKIISSDGPAYAVLETNAGYAQKIGLKVGDQVEHAMFAPRE